MFKNTRIIEWNDWSLVEKLDFWMELRGHYCHSWRGNIAEQFSTCNCLLCCRSTIINEQLVMVDSFGSGQVTRLGLNSIDRSSHKICWASSLCIWKQASSWKRQIGFWKNVGLAMLVTTCFIQFGPWLQNLERGPNHNRWGRHIHIFGSSYLQKTHQRLLLHMLDSYVKQPRWTRYRVEGIREVRPNYYFTLQELDFSSCSFANRLEQWWEFKDFYSQLEIK
jgi:hypothetical protein